MSYHESSITCDYCSKDIENGKTVACGKCIYELEARINDLLAEIEKLKDK